MFIYQATAAFWDVYITHTSGGNALDFAHIQQVSASCMCWFSFQYVGVIAEHSKRDFAFKKTTPDSMD